MWEFTWYCTIMMLVASSVAIHLSPTMQKTALFQFQQGLAVSISNGRCYNYAHYNIYDVPSHPKTMNWSMSSDYCTWDGVTCENMTGNIIGLDLGCSLLVGAIFPNSTLFQLSHLRFLNLSWNDFSLSNQFPQEFGFFAPDLTHLDLSYTSLSGRVPSGISHLYKLVSLHLSGNFASPVLEYKVFKLMLQNLTQLRVLDLQWLGINSVLPMNLSTSLRVLNLRDNGLHGDVPQEVFHLPNLEVLDLSDSNLTVTFPKGKWGSSGTLQHLYLVKINVFGGLPDSIAFLESLATLFLYNCKLSGPIPEGLANLTKLSFLHLSMNNLVGPFPSKISHLRELVWVNLAFNSLTGPVPSWLFEVTSLKVLNINDNRFTGQLYKFNSSNSQLQSFSCGNNLLHGPIPRSFFQLENITKLDFSSNNFSGVLDIEMFSRLEYLHTLDLSNNNLSVRDTSMETLPPKLIDLNLASCKMKTFPHFFRDAEMIQRLDLSNNQIEGEIPHWIGSMYLLNLSYNSLTGGLEQIPWDNLQYLDLQSNMLDGSLPSFICNSSSLEVLNLSHNKLSGVLPICQKNLTPLSVFDLRNNNIQGNLPSTLSNLRHLKSLNLHGNELEGTIPSSFAEFDHLETLDVGSNQMSGEFPQCLESLPNLQVPVLKSNRFRGLINTSSNIDHPFPSLRIIDLSYNEFTGTLPEKYLKNFEAMMDSNVNNIEPSYMGGPYYSDSTTLVIKGVEFELVRILTIFTTIDVSRNNFFGEIAEEVGNLVSLRFLNFSYNHLSGHIPSSIGKLSMLESLDLSFNRLEGEIPQQLTSIYSLARLNLSCNQLRGRIPEGWQFNTFENNSYVGNSELCGHPLSKMCENDYGTQEEEEEEEEEEEDEDTDYIFSGFTWKAVVIGYGCGVVPAFIIGYLMLLARKPKWFAGIIARELDIKIRRMEIKWSKVLSRQGI